MLKWHWLYDDYERGTVFITDDPAGEQEAIVSGLTQEQAERIVREHNLTVIRWKPSVRQQGFRPMVDGIDYDSSEQ